MKELSAILLRDKLKSHGYLCIFEATDDISNEIFWHYGKPGDSEMPPIQFSNNRFLIITLDSKYATSEYFVGIRGTDLLEPVDEIGEVRFYPADSL